MNKDKAIRLLERLQDPEPYEPMLTKDAYDAIRMAIDALSADGDTISRKAAIEICDHAIDLLKGQFGAGALVAIKESIEELPPVQPEQLGTNLAEVGTDCISRQAAIDAARDWYEGLICGSFKGLEKRLRALPSAQPEPCEDAVSREVLKDGFTEMCNLICPYTKKQQHVMCGSCLMGTAFDVLEATPSVTPKQRTGKWIKLDMHRGMADHKCTACEQECYVPTCMGEPLYAFCPNCGSYNGGEQDDKCRQV